MPRKTIIIFITTFILVGVIILTVYYLLNRKNTPTSDTTTPWYQGFNPFGSGSNTTDNNNTQNNNEDKTPIVEETPTSKFSQITDFAIAGATFLEDTRPIINTGVENTPKPTQIKTIISPNTKDGRKEIQTILNETLALKPPLIVDGNFGNKVKEAIKSFQKLNNIAVTGIIDVETAPYFTKVDTSTSPVKDLFEEVPSIRFVERMNGHIYKMFLDTKIKEKISNSTIPSIYEAFFDKTANTVIYRYLSINKTISSFIATLGASKGEFLPQDISDLSVSPNKTKFFYLTKNSDGSIGITGSFGETERNIVFNSPFTEWLSQWDNNQRVFLTTKPSYSVLGSVFLLNTTNKTLSKIFGGVMGLTTLINPNGSLVLYSSYSKTGPSLGVFDTEKYSTKDLVIYDLPEKCVWSSDNINIYCAVPNTITGDQYPDVWYQGLISFDDYFVKINTSTGEKVTIANSADETNVDGINLFLNKTEDTLFFTNKKDSTLWSLDIR